MRAGSMPRSSSCFRFRSKNPTCELYGRPRSLPSGAAMAIHLLRHAEAGNRPSWHQPDDLRPLTSNGVVQSVNVADALDGRPITRILSSRYVRCVQTAQPLADRVGLTVESHAALAEEADVAATWALLEEVAAAGEAGDTVLCSHGNVI